MRHEQRDSSDGTPKGGLIYRPGTLIARRYEVIRCLGRGAAGTVYLCRERDDASSLKAIKILSDFAVNSVLFTRFYREAKAARRIHSPYVVSSYDLVVDDGVFAYTMEYVDGRSLGEMLLLTPCPALPLALRALWEIGQGLIAVHDAGLVHRDLKPGNVLVTNDLHFKITDFGIVHQAHELNERPKAGSFVAKLLRFVRGRGVPLDSKLTGQGEILGTVDYLSPEYVESDMVDERSDLYSLGTLGFQVLSGHLPYEDGDTLRRLEARVRFAPSSLEAFRPDIPPAFTELIMACLERKPERRPQNAREFVQALEQALSKSGIGYVMAPRGQEQQMLER